jgi:GH24 family phage-related lysozyme (muramidase)
MDSRSRGALRSTPENDMATVIEYVELKKKIELYEGNIEHMYLDSNGFVTVGVGHMIPNASHAAALTFYVTKTAVPATEEQKKAEYEAILKESKGKVASWYKSKTSLFMKPADIDALTRKHIESFEKELKNLYSAPAYPPGFEKFPEEVRLALFDMIFNLGATKLRNSYLSFNLAIAKSDWEKAASQCFRKGIQVTRNNYVKDLFQKAAAKKAAAPAAPATGATNAP